MVGLFLLAIAVAMTADLQQLVQQLQSADEGERCAAAEGLARRGDAAQVAAVPLVVACGDRSEEVAQWATGALEELGPPAAADAGPLAALLDEENADVAYWAATLLGRLGPEAEGQVPSLGKALAGHPAANVRQRAAWALGRIGPGAAAVADELENAARSGDPRLARLAVRALERLEGSEP